VASAATVKVAPRRKRFLALIPFFFAVQQALEGIQWLSVKTGNACLSAGYSYLVFALIVWPIFIPGAVYYLDRRGRRVSRWFLALGIGVALWLGVFLIGQLSIGVAHGNIFYHAAIPAGFVVAVLYVVAVCGALLTSHIRTLQWFGALALLSAGGAFLWFRTGFPSVWCFFAALISALVFWYARSR